MTQPRRYAVILLPPLVMSGVLMLPVPSFVRGLTEPLFAIALVYAIALGFVLFWGCIWISHAICKVLVYLEPRPDTQQQCARAFFFAVAGSIGMGLATHSMGSWHVFTDVLQQTVAFVLCYAIYRVLVRRGETKRPATHLHLSGP